MPKEWKLKTSPYGKIKLTFSDEEVELILFKPDEVDRIYLAIQGHTEDVETDRDDIQTCIDDLSTESEDSIWTFHKICDVLVVTKSSIFIQHEKKNRETLYASRKYTRTHLEGRLVELFGLDPAVASDYAENLIASMR